MLWAAKLLHDLVILVIVNFFGAVPEERRRYQGPVSLLITLDTGLTKALEPQVERCKTSMGLREALCTGSGAQ